ncbi:MAG TPA: ROK family protein [Bryobacteraceae bacterium]|nr:ROK family protein [Bryobacteraceae bacterium]
MKHVTGKPERDKRVIEAVVRRFGPISRSRIHELTDISTSATSVLVRELMDEGRLLETGRAANGKGTGRNEVLLELDEDFRFIAAVEFDEENVMAGVLNMHPAIRNTVSEPANLHGGVDGLVNQLVSCTRKVLEKAGLETSSLLGIGIADPGLVDSRRGVTVTSSTIDFWNQVPLQEIFEKEFGVPALVQSKTRAKTVAERVLGAGEMLDSMVYVDYGVGIGAGLILDGKLLLGERGAAGEFGHTHALAGGPACLCGSYGCLEAVAGARAVEARMRRLIAQGGNSQALALAGGDPGNITVWNILEASSRGDKVSSNIVAEVAGYLGVGLADLINLFNPSVIVLDKRLEAGGRELLDEIRLTVRRQALAWSNERIAIRFAQLGSEAGILGLTMMILERYFEIPVLRPPRFMIEPAILPQPAERAASGRGERLNALHAESGGSK